MNSMQTLRMSRYIYFEIFTPHESMTLIQTIYDLNRLTHLQYQFHCTEKPLKKGIQIREEEHTHTHKNQTHQREIYKKPLITFQQ